MPLDKEKMKTWDIAKVVHHGSESWAYDEIKCLLYNNIIFILTILCLITYLIFKYKKITIF